MITLKLNPFSMKKTLHTSLVAISAALAAVDLAHAQTWSGLGADQNWSTGNNWVGNAAPTSSGAVAFNDGPFPATTNVLGAVNNIVQSSLTIGSLTYANNGAANDFDTTLIPAGNTLTVAGNIMVGNAGVAVNSAVTGGGTMAGGNGTSTLTVQSTSGTATWDLSHLTNFVFISSGTSAAISLSTGSSSASGAINLANGSNNVVTTTLSLGNNNTGGAGTMNLGNGTNNIFADTISMGVDKTSGTMQFLNNAGGGLKIANHTGTGRATINLGSVASSGSTSAKTIATMAFNGGTVNVLASTMTVGNRGNRTVSGGNGSNTGFLSFNNGVVDATTINLAINSSGAPGFGTISVGTAGTLKVGTGGLSLVNSAGAGLSSGVLIVTNGGTVICSNFIYKTTSQGTGTVTVADSTLSVAGGIGTSNGIPVDFFNVTNSTLTLSLASVVPAVSAVNFNPDATVQDTINISALPTISQIPVQYKIITYTTAGGNLNKLVLGSLPLNFSGYVSNNVSGSSIDLVLTNGPVAKNDQWGGGVNNQWDITSLDWTNNSVAVTYNDLDNVSFDDFSTVTNVNIIGSRAPATWAMNNNTRAYIFTGTGKITGPVQLVMNASGSVTLAETGGDNFSGGIQVNGGTVILDNTNSSISGGLTINGGTVAQVGNNDGVGTLPGGTINDGGSLIFARTNALSVGGGIAGGGAVTQNGSGTLTFTGSETYSGNTLINAGTLALTGSGALPNSPNVTVNNATFSVSGVTSTTVTTLNNLNMTNSVLNVEVAYLQTNLVVNGIVSLGGVSNLVNVISLPPIVSYPFTVALLRSQNTLNGYNFVLGSLPAGSPANAGTIALSSDQTEVLLTLTAGPIGTRPSVTWSGVDAGNTGNTNWSDAPNWVTPGAPNATEKATFNNTATVGGSPFNAIGDGVGGIVNQGNVNNFVDINLTNAGITYANSSGVHNTQIGSGLTLTENGSMLIDGSGGLVSVLGSGGTLQLNNPVNATTFNVQATAAPVLDMSGLDVFDAVASQFAVGFNLATPTATVSGVWYLAKTNIITTGNGSSGTSTTFLIGGSTTQNSAGNAQVYLGQTNSLSVDGILLGIGPSSGNVFEFNPNLVNPAVYIRGTTGGSSRVTLWTLGDDTVNVNNAIGGGNELADFTLGTLDARVNTLVVGQGAQGNTVNSSVVGTFNMGAGNLDVTTLGIGIGDNGKAGGNGNGVLNVAGGSVEVNTLNLAMSGPAQTTGTLNLSANATMVVSNAVNLGTSTAGATLSLVSSTLKVLNGSIGTSANGLVTLNLDGATLQMNVDGNATPTINATNVTTGAMTTINLPVINNVFGTVQIPFLRYQGSDPFSALHLGTIPGGFTVTLVDDTANSSVDLNIISPFKPTPPIKSFNVNGTTLNLAATNGQAGSQVVLVGATNLTTPFAQWTPVLTNSFDSNGNLNLSTNVVNLSVPQEYYRIKQ